MLNAATRRRAAAGRACWLLAACLEPSTSDLSPALIGRERGLALAGRASRQNSATAEAACKQGRIRPSIQSALAQWDKSLAS
jgi:hypothetical protein